MDRDKHNQDYQDRTTVAASRGKNEVNGDSFVLIKVIFSRFKH